jgi:hypothetical protein
MSGDQSAPRGARDRRVRARLALTVVLGCVAVGVAASATAAAGSWSIVPSPNPSTSTRSWFSGVACPTTSRCYAVGGTGGASSYATLVQRWNGTGWARMTSSNPSGTTAAELFDVACTGKNACTAVGYFESSGIYKTLIERWNGTAWSKVKSPNPSGSPDSELYDVSCPSSTFCAAVGAYEDGGTGNWKTLVAHWNGTTWSRVKSPNPSGSTDSELFSVSCTSATRCRAVGFSTVGGGFVSLVERWNGTGWARMTSPDPPGTTDSELFQVSCTAKTFCMAVGTYETSGTFKTLVERWDGSTWSIVASPNPVGSTDSELWSVACTSASVCTAVGYATPDPSTTLVEQWNGTKWSRAASPNAGSGAANTLANVACKPTLGCFAVGNYSKAGVRKTLVEFRP